MILNKLFSRNLHALLCKQSYQVKYTRSNFRQEVVNAELIKKTAEDLHKLELQNQIFNTKQNDKNPLNYIKVKVNYPAMFDYKRLPEIQPYIIKPKPRQPKRLISANKKYMRTSLSKMYVVLHGMGKLHITEAIHRLKQSHRKVAKLMIKTFYNLIDHARSQNMDPLRLYVYGIIMGKTQRFKGIRYQAKGRSYPETKDICQAKVILYEKSTQQFFRDIVDGKDIGFANELKGQFIRRDSSLEDIRQFKDILTSRSRQQLREITKRKIALKMKQNEKNNIFIPKKVVKEQIIKGLSKKYEERFLKFRNQVSGIALREQHYKKNIEG